MSGEACVECGKSKSKIKTAVFDEDFTGKYR